MQDDQRDREADERVAELEAERHDYRAADDSEGDESIGACVVSVGDKCRAAEALAGAEADQCGDLVADESDRAGGGECAEVGERLWVDQPLDRLPERDAGTDEDCCDNEVAGRLLAAGTAQEESDSEWQSGESVTEVVDQIGQQRDAVRAEEDADLDQRGGEENDEADRDGPDALAGADDRRVDEPVRVSMSVGAVVRVLVLQRAPALFPLTGSGRPSRRCSTW